jgi:hypothetical protein
LIFGDDALTSELTRSFPVGLGKLEGGAGGFDSPLGFDQLGRCRIGNDFKQRVTGGHPVTDLDRAPFDDTRDLGLDLELEPRFDLAHRDGLLGDGPALDLDQLEGLFFLPPLL